MNKHFLGTPYFTPGRRICVLWVGSCRANLDDLWDLTRLRFAFVCPISSVRQSEINDGQK